MKRLLTTVLAFSVSLLLINSSIALGKVPAAKLELLTLKDVYQSGDKVYISGEGFQDNEEIMAAVIDVYNEDGTSNIKPIKQSELEINSQGKLSGTIVLEGVDIDDRFAQISIFTKNTNTLPSEKFQVLGNLPPFYSPRNII